jgi:hypothetical protein
VTAAETAAEILEHPLARRVFPDSLEMLGKLQRGEMDPTGEAVRMRLAQMEQQLAAAERAQATDEDEELEVVDGDDDEEPAPAPAPAGLPRPTRLRDVSPDAGLEYLAERLLIWRDINAIVGDGGAMKSTEWYAIAAAIATGNPVFGVLPAKTGPVVIVSGEDSKPVIRNRLVAVAEGHGWDVDLLLDNVHTLTQQDDGVALDTAEWQLHLMAVVGDLGAILTVFDPLIDLYGDTIKENSNDDAKRVTRYFRRLITATGTTVGVALHVSKPAEGKTERQHRVRGAGVWKNATRQCWWSEPAGGGVELEDIKRNRSSAKGIIRLKVEIESEADNELVWRKATLEVDDAGSVVNIDVIRLLLYLNGATEPLSGRDIDNAPEHGLSRNRATDARMSAKNKKWINSLDGSRNAKLWSLTDAGRARLMLSPEYDRSVSRASRASRDTGEGRGQEAEVQDSPVERPGALKARDTGDTQPDRLSDGPSRDTGGTLRDTGRFYEVDPGEPGYCGKHHGAEERAPSGEVKCRVCFPGLFATADEGRARATTTTEA